VATKFPRETITVMYHGQPNKMFRLQMTASQILPARTLKITLAGPTTIHTHARVSARGRLVVSGRRGFFVLTCKG
jgi:hypothetical protein